MYDRNLKYDVNLKSYRVRSLRSPVDVGDGQVKGLGLQLVFLPNLHQPVHQDGAHGVGDVRLLDHVIMLGHKLHLLLSEVGVNVLRKITCELGEWVRLLQLLVKSIKIKILKK